MTSGSLSRVARILLGAMMLLAMPIGNGLPTMFADTRAYMSLGEAAWSKVATKPDAQVAAPVQDPEAQAAASENPKERLRRSFASAGARSPYFSVYLYLLATLGGMWLVACAQALMTALTIDVFYRAIGVRSSGAYVATMAALAALSTAPIFVAFMMPDIFAGLGAVAAVALIIRPFKTRLWESAFLAAIVGFAALVHSTHVVIIAAAAFGAAVAALACRASAMRTLAGRLGLVALLALLGPVGSVAYGIAAKAALGEEIHRPPFLTARLLEDGPGRTFLAASCNADADAFELCKYRDRKLDDSQAFLWARGQREGVFASADADGRIRLSRDEMRFVTGTLAYAPLAVAEAALRNIGELATSTRVDDVTDTAAVYQDPEFRTLAPYVSGTQVCVEDPARCAPRLPIHFLGQLTGAAAIAAFLLTLAALATAWAARARQSSARAVVAGLWLAWLANLVICGAFSGPYARYETRMTWVILLGACAVVALRREARLTPKSDPAAIRETS